MKNYMDGLDGLLTRMEYFIVLLYVSLPVGYLKISQYASASAILDLQSRTDEH